MKDKSRRSRRHRRSAQRAACSAFFNFGSEPDSKDSKVEIAAADQGGLSLPDRDYYFKTDAKSVELRKATSSTSRRCSSCYGESPEKAAADAKTVMKLETELAKASLDRIEQRDPNKIYHKMTTGRAAAADPRVRVEASTSPPFSRPRSTASTSPCPTL